ncbi:unnamed protein product [Paramecium primaurelia]|uniref:Transmembrane protein n=1 Tax=Paramecium primaurelia TaxID=5886 RepID=A0A8S1NPG8_PARPR|nr:unnamed protein product [Paramecium primaurelia]
MKVFFGIQSPTIYYILNLFFYDQVKFPIQYCLSNKRYKSLCIHFLKFDVQKIFISFKIYFFLLAVIVIQNQVQRNLMIAIKFNIMVAIIVNQNAILDVINAIMGIVKIFVYLMNWKLMQIASNLNLKIKILLALVIVVIVLKDAKNVFKGSVYFFSQIIHFLEDFVMKLNVEIEQQNLLKIAMMVILQIMMDVPMILKLNRIGIVLIRIHKLISVFHLHKYKVLLIYSIAIFQKVIPGNYSKIDNFPTKDSFKIIGLSSDGYFINFNPKVPISKMNLSTTKYTIHTYLVFNYMKPFWMRMKCFYHQLMYQLNLKFLNSDNISINSFQDFTKCWLWHYDQFELQWLFNITFRKIFINNFIIKHTLVIIIFQILRCRISIKFLNLF